MNNIEELTEEEKKTLCKIISGKEFQSLFKQNEKHLGHILRGFRAKSLPEEQALRLAITHFKEPEIAIYVNHFVDQNVNQIQSNIKQYEDDGSSHFNAVAQALSESPFADNIDLYFKLAGTPEDEDTCKDLQKRISNIRVEQTKEQETENQIKDLNEKNRKLTEQLEESQHGMEALIAEYHDKILVAESEKNRLTDQLEQAQQQIAELQSSPVDMIQDDPSSLAKYNDTDPSVLPAEGDEEMVSLCSVYTDRYCNTWLRRYADLNRDAHFQIFNQDINQAPYFENRDLLFKKDGPSDEDFYGIWNWTASANQNDPSKDYISSKFNNLLDAIEVVTFSDITTLDDLVKLLKQGISIQPHSRKTMFSVQATKEEYSGILLTAKQLKYDNEKSVLADHCTEAPVYEFTGEDLIRLDNGLSFYRNAFAGVPSRLYHFYTPLEIVKNIVNSSISWNAYKKSGILRTEEKKFKNFLNDLPVDDITRQISEKCHCSVPAAKNLLSQFLDIAWKYIDGDSIEDQIIFSAISASPKLQNKAKEMLRQDWETENESKLEEASRELDSVHSEIHAAREKLHQAQEKLKRTEEEEQKIADAISEKKNFADDVEKAVDERIRKAQQNAADFIASMAFVNGPKQQSEESAPHSDVSVLAEQDTSTYQINPVYKNSDDLEQHHSWHEVFSTAISELSYAGVAQRYTHGLAAFLCAAYIEKQPLFLIGPNAIDIAQAFSAAVTAHQYGVLSCSGNYSSQTVSEIGSGHESIVIIQNLLESGWISWLPEILSQKDIFYIATHPYAEDVQVEPKGLYSYMLPLFTEILVDRKATGDYIGGCFADDFVPYSGKRKHKDLAVLSKFALNPLVRNQISSVSATMHDLYPRTTADDDFAFCIFPIAYACLATDKLSEIISEPQNGAELSADLKRDLQCVLGEI